MERPQNPAKTDGGAALDGGRIILIDQGMRLKPEIIAILTRDDRMIGGGICGFWRI
jgi:hypothetical protein